MPSKQPLSERLWRRVVRTDSCWPWAGYRTRQGYGVIGVDNHKTALVHRVAWELTNGSVPDGLQVLHRCDNPPCCNPAHLFLGTNTDNVADREQKGRQMYRRCGAAHGNAKLTDAIAIAIHADTRTQDVIAAAFGVSQSTVHRIKARASGGWTHLALPEKRKFKLSQAHKDKIRASMLAKRDKKARAA